MPLDPAMANKKRKKLKSQDAHPGNMRKTVAKWTLISPTYMEKAATYLHKLGYPDVFAKANKWDITNAHYELLREHLGSDGCVVIDQCEGQEF